MLMYFLLEGRSVDIVRFILNGEREVRCMFGNVVCYAGGQS